MLGARYAISNIKGLVAIPPSSGEETHTVQHVLRMR